MGCDIHIIAEVKKDGKWVINTDKVFKNPYYSPERIQEKKEGYKKRLNMGEITQEEMSNWIKSDVDFFGEEYQSKPPDSRNYDWFSILANVRNGMGFAGVVTGQGFNYISTPKGVPHIDGFGVFPKFEKSEKTIIDEYGNMYKPYILSNIENDELDCSDEWVKEIIDWSVDMHSHSWLTVDEFDKFDWNQVTMKYGIIPIKLYKTLRETNKTPESWNGMISGNDIIVIDDETADKIIAGELTELTKSDPFTDEDTRNVKEWDIYVGYNWSILYSEWFSYNIKNTIEPLRKLNEKYGDARIIFGFDN